MPKEKNFFCEIYFLDLVSQNVCALWKTFLRSKFTSVLLFRKIPPVRHRSFRKKNVQEFVFQKNIFP